MKTDDLIAALARDAKPSMPAPRQLVGRHLAVAVPLAAVVFAVLLGLRADVSEALAEIWFPLKLALAGGLAVVGHRLLLALAQPGRAVPVAAVGLLVGAVLLAGLADLAVLGVDGSAERLLGDNGVKCLAMIPLLAALPLAGLLLALRDSAPVQPALAGAAAGLLAAGLGALLYGLSCTDDSPLFFLVWYGVAAAVVTGAGALAGRRWLTW